jgi:hypothetical protein
MLVTRSPTRPCRILPTSCPRDSNDLEAVVLRKKWEREMQALVIVVGILVILAIAAGRHGVDSRDGFDGSRPGRPSGPGLS